MRAAPALLPMLLATPLAGCGGPPPEPPPLRMFDGLPTTGSARDAERLGFTTCVTFTTEIRCRREGVLLLGHGPFSAAVDLGGSEGERGFDHLVLWHDRDQNALLTLTGGLRAAGWQGCLTGDDDRGDQAIYTRPDMPVRLSLDLSYWGKRRLRVIPDTTVPPNCRPL
jgi:hypothetical protein